MWACEPVNHTTWGFVPCGERKYFETLNQARAYAHEWVDLNLKNGLIGYPRYQIYKVGGVPMRHHIDNTKTHFVTFKGCWTE